MPWSMISGAVAGAMAADEASANNTAAARRAWPEPSVRRDPPMSTHCAPCGAPLEGSVCSYCRTPAPGWRNQAAGAGVGLELDAAFGLASVRPEWAGQIK